MVFHIISIKQSCQLRRVNGKPSWYKVEETQIWFLDFEMDNDHFLNSSSVFEQIKRNKIK